MENVDELDVVPIVDNKPVAQNENVGDVLSVISLKEPIDESDPDRLVKRNSFRSLQRPNISHLDWVSSHSGATQKEDAVVERVRSFHSSFTSLSQSTTGNVLGSRQDVMSHSSARLPTRDYSPTHVTPIVEESHEMLTRVNTLADVQTTGDQVDSNILDEVVIWRQSLGELLPGDIATAADKALAAVENQNAEAQTHSILAIVDRLTNTDERKCNLKTDSKGQGLPGNKTTVSTKFPRRYELVDQAPTGNPTPSGRVNDEALVHAGISHERIKRDFNDVLTETLQAFSVLDAIENQQALRLEKAADNLTTDAMKLAIGRINDDTGLPLSQLAIRAADSVVVDMLQRTLQGDREQLSAIEDRSTFVAKLGSTIVLRVLDSACSTVMQGNIKWTDKALRAAKLVVEDVLSSTLNHVSSVSDDEDVKPIHVWSSPAITAACRIVHDVMTKAAHHELLLVNEVTARFWEPPQKCRVIENVNQLEMTATSKDRPDSKVRTTSTEQPVSAPSDGDLPATGTGSRASQSKSAAANIRYQLETPEPPNDRPDSQVRTTSIEQPVSAPSDGDLPATGTGSRASHSKSATANVRDQLETPEPPNNRPDSQVRTTSIEQPVSAPSDGDLPATGTGSRASQSKSATSKSGEDELSIGSFDDSMYSISPKERPASRMTSMFGQRPRDV